MILNIQVVFSCHVCLAVGQLTGSFAEHKGCTVSQQSLERARCCNIRDGGFEEASTPCSKCAARCVCH